MKLPTQVNFKFQIIFLSSILYLLSSAFLLILPAKAQSPSPNPYTAPNTNPDVPQNLHSYTQNVVIEVLSAATCQLTGIDPVNPNQACLGVDKQTGKIGFAPSSDSGGGAIGVMGNMISMLYTIPIHTGDYVHYLAQNFGVSQKAYAQGTGFEGLKPLLDIWTAFRNIVYIIFIIVFVVIGVAIMFRIKIDPRTVMTIQNQIPKIIIGIVLVTFSYAIAGFLIDIMYGSIYLMGNVITSATKQSPAVVTNVAQSSNPFSAASHTVGLKDVILKPGKAAGEFMTPVFDNPAGKTLTGVIAAIIGTQIRKAAVAVYSGGKSILKFFNVLDEVVTKTPKFGPTDLVIGAVTGIATGGILAFFGKDIDTFILSLVAFLIITIAILWSLFKLWFVLIMAYVYILIGVVLAPFWVAAGIFPGIPINFTGWLRWMLARIAVFPTTVALFLLGKTFIEAFGTSQTGFVPPLIGNPSDTSAIGALIGLGIILLSSNVANMTQRMFNAPKIDLGRIGQALGVGVGVPISAVKTGATSIIGGAEWVPSGPGGGFKQRGTGSALFGRLFGR